MSEWPSGRVAEWPKGGRRTRTQHRPRPAIAKLAVPCLMFHFATSPLCHSVEAAVSGGQDSQLESGLANQGGRATGSSRFKQQSAVGDVFTSHRIGGSRFHIFPGVFSGSSSSGIVPPSKLDLGGLYAKTDALGKVIPPAAWQTDRDPLFIWEPPKGTVDVAGYSYALDATPDDTVDTAATSFDVAGTTPNTLPDGKHTFSVKAIGTGGTAGNPLSLDLWVDTTPPQIATRAPEAGALFKAAPEVTVTVSDAHSGLSASTITVLVNGEPAAVQFDAQAGTLAATGGGWKEGSNNIELRVADAVGNLQTPAVWTVTLDQTPPAGTVAINGRAVMTTSAYVTLNLSAEDALSGVDHLLISNDALTGYVQEPFTSLRELWRLNPVRGVQAVFVKFVDRAGNASAPVTDAIELALLSPETVITSGPAGFAAEPRATFAFMCPEGGCVFSYAFDNAPWSDWSPTPTAAAESLPFGNHYFRVKAAKDVNGTAGIQPDEEDPSPAERTWIAGVEPSVFSIPKGPHIKLWRLE